MKNRHIRGAHGGELGGAGGSVRWGRGGEAALDELDSVCQRLTAPDSVC